MMTLSPTDREDLRIAMAAIQQARARAQARGLSTADIEAEEDDEDSQYWEDVAAIARTLRGEIAARQH